MLTTSWTEEGTEAHYAVQLAAELPGWKVFDPAAGTGRLYGQFARAWRTGADSYEAIRDPLGIGKLFYTEVGSGEILFAENFPALFSHRTKIFAVPAGCHVRLERGGRRELVRDFRSGQGPGPELTSASLAAGFTDETGRHFQTALTRRLRTSFSLYRALEDDGWQFFVALSGGLDSSIIATAAIQHLARPVACTLDLGRSEDAEKSALIARHLNIRHLLFGAGAEDIRTALAAAPLLCQDFRDFNVHCAALNLLLAKDIRAWGERHVPQAAGKMIVLTGDLMNEFVCDYAEEKIDDRVYYRLPRVGGKELQRTLIRGLDTSDRELQPFRHHGLHCIQPYAIAHDLYASLGEDVLQTPDVKRLLNGFLVPKAVRALLPRNKLRAQVGSKEHMGILGLCHRAGITDRTFRESLLAQAGGEEDQIPIFVGKYDVEKFTKTS